MNRSPVTLSAFCVISALVLTACGGDSSDSEPPITHDDPLVGHQWHLHNVGQSAFASRGGRPGVDLNVNPVYAEGNFGQGVPVLVVDSGLESTHEDLAANINPSMLHNFDPKAPDPHDAMPPGPPFDVDDPHGTAVAGIIGAVRNNQKGGVGVAPEVALGGVRLLCTGCYSSENTLAAFGNAPFSENTWVFNGSYGITPFAPINVDYDDDPDLLALRGLMHLRDGKGAIFVKAAGNDFRAVREPADSADRDRCEVARSLLLTCHNTNSDPESIPPMTFLVAGVNADGRKASYSSAGASVLISGFSGEYGLSHPTKEEAFFEGPAHIAPDFSNCEFGNARRGDDDYLSDFDNPDSSVGRRHNPHCQYSASMNGTSSAAPTVAGVAALMLAANPELGWRELRDILIRTARTDMLTAPPVVALPLADGDYLADDGWQRNAAGRLFSNWYGFGLVDAAAAVQAAQEYRPPMGPFTDTQWISSSEAANPGNAAAQAFQNNGQAVPPDSIHGATLTIDVPHDLTIESVVAEVFLTGEAPFHDLGVEVISPSGTRSVLLNPHSAFADSPASSAQEGLLLASNAFYDEPAAGVWTLRVVDINSRQNTTSNANLKHWRLRVYGH